MFWPIVKFIISLILGYVIGSIPTGYLAVKLLKKEDVREIGSGSTGATNVKRVLGTKWFYIVMLIDAIKGMICIWIGRHLDYYIFAGLGPTLAGVGAVVGHSKSIFLKGTGGKSVATGVGTLIMLSPIVGWITAAIWAVLTFSTKMVSVGSVVALCVAPILMQRLGRYECYFYYALFLAAFIVYTHRENLKRLFEGKENKI